MIPARLQYLAPELQAVMGLWAVSPPTRSTWFQSCGWRGDITNMATGEVQHLRHGGKVEEDAKRVSVELRAVQDKDRELTIIVSCACARASVGIPHVGPHSAWIEVSGWRA